MADTPELSKLEEIAILLRQQREDSEFDRQEAKAAATEAAFGNEERTQEENARKKETEENQEETVSLLEAINENFEMSFKGQGSGFLGAIGRTIFLMASLAASLATPVGIIEGFIDGTKQVFKTFTPKGIQLAISNFFTRITKFFKVTLFAKLTEGISKVLKINYFNEFQKVLLKIRGLLGFKNLNVQLLLPLDDMMTRLTRLGNAIKKNKAVRGATTFVKTTFGFITGFIDDVSKFFRTLFRIVVGGGPVAKQMTLFQATAGSSAGFITKTIKSFINFFQASFRIFKRLFPIFRNVGRLFGVVVSKIFVPLTIIQGVFAGVKGAIDGFMSEDGNLAQKLISGLTTAFANIVEILITAPIDMLKNGIAWLVGLFNKDIAEDMKAFSFAELFNKIIFGIGDFVNNAIDFVMKFMDPAYLFAKVKQMMESMGDIAGSFIRKILRSVLPPADIFKFTLPAVDLGILGKFGGGSINLNPIPKFLYDVAAKPAGNSELQSTISTTSPRTGATMAAIENNIADQKSANAGAPVIVQQVGGQREGDIISTTTINAPTTPDRDLTVGQFAIPAGMPA